MLASPAAPFRSDARRSPPRKAPRPMPHHTSIAQRFHTIPRRDHPRATSLSSPVVASARLSYLATPAEPNRSAPIASPPVLKPADHALRHHTSPAVPILSLPRQTGLGSPRLVNPRRAAPHLVTPASPSRQRHSTGRLSTPILTGPALPCQTTPIRASIPNLCMPILARCFVACPIRPIPD